METPTPSTARTSLSIRFDTEDEIKILHYKIMENGTHSFTGDTYQKPGMTYEEATEEAKEFWIQFFDEEPEELYKMEHRLKTFFDSNADAAEFVLEHDGDHHGLELGEFDGFFFRWSSGCQIYDQFPKEIQEFWQRYHLTTLDKNLCDRLEAIAIAEGGTVLDS